MKPYGITLLCILSTIALATVIYSIIALTETDIDEESYDKDIVAQIDIETTNRYHRLVKDLKDNQGMKRVRLPAHSERDDLVAFTCSNKYKYFVLTHHLNIIAVYNCLNKLIKKIVVNDFNDYTLDARLLHIDDVCYALYCNKKMFLHRIKNDGIIDETNNTSIRLWFDGQDVETTERNWSLLKTKNNEYYFITRLMPLQVAKLIDVTTGECTLVQDDVPNWKWNGNDAFIRGNTSLINMEKMMMMMMRHI